MRWNLTQVNNALNRQIDFEVSVYCIYVLSFSIMINLHLMFKMWRMHRCLTPARRCLNSGRFANEFFKCIFIIIIIIIIIIVFVLAIVIVIVIVNIISFIIIVVVVIVIIVVVIVIIIIISIIIIIIIVVIFIITFIIIILISLLSAFAWVMICWRQAMTLTIAGQIVLCHIVGHHCS